MHAHTEYYLQLLTSTTTITTILGPLYTSTCVSQHLQLRTGGAKFWCQHVLFDGNQRIWIMEKMLEFSSTVLSTLSPYYDII